MLFLIKRIFRKWDSMKWVGELVDGQTGSPHHSESASTSGGDPDKVVGESKDKFKSKCTSKCKRVILTRWLGPQEGDRQGAKCSSTKCGARAQMSRYPRCARSARCPRCTNQPRCSKQQITELHLSANEQICKLCKGFKLAYIQCATVVQAVIRWRRMPSASH